MYLGLDIGSSSSKAVLLGENQESLAAQVVNLGTGTKGVGQVLEAVYRQAGIGPEEVRYTVVTGYGRMTYQGADRQITEISCHAKGVFHLSSSARTIVDVGGQDTKVIRLGPFFGSNGPGAGLPHCLPLPAGPTGRGSGSHQQSLHGIR